MRKALLLFTILATILVMPAGTAFALEKGATLPALQGETLEGDIFEFSSLKGKPAIIKIGTTWCGTCQEQAKTLSKMHDFLKENDVHYVEVFIQESAKKVNKYLHNNGHRPDTVILDDGDISTELNIYLIPRVIILDRELKVFRDGENLSSQELKQELKAMLATTPS